MIIRDFNFPEFIENIPVEKKIFLLHGTSSSKIWYYRKRLELKLIGSKALELMKLVFLDKNQIQKDKEVILNEIKTRSFFGDKKVIVVNEISDKETNNIKNILENINIEDHYLILTAGYLGQKSSLRKLLENDSKSCSIGFYSYELNERDIINQLNSYKIKVDNNAIIKKLRDLSSNYDFLEFKQELKKLYLYKYFDKSPISIEDVDNVFSFEFSSNEKKLFDYLMIKNKEFIVDFFSNYPGEIKNPNGFLFTASNQFKIFLKMISTEDLSFSFLKTLWPPITGKNRDKFVKNLKFWQKSSIEAALLILKETELNIRQNSNLSAKKALSFAFLSICSLNN